MGNLYKMLFGIALELVAIFLVLLGGLFGGGGVEIFFAIVAALVAVGGIVICVVAINGEQSDKPANKNSDGADEKSEDN